MKNRTVGATLILLLVFTVSGFVLILKQFENDAREKVSWNSSNDRFITNFIVGEGGHIYIKAVVNNIAGLFLFDTGAELSAVNEKYVTGKNMKLPPVILTDAKGIKQIKNLYIVKFFELGPIRIKRLHVYPTDSLAWTDPKGFHYKQDSILGIIGCNIISKFVWDFDLIKKRVTVSRSKTYSKNIPDSLAIQLVSKNNHKDIVAQINGQHKQLTLDFGSAFPISLSDSIPNRSLKKKITYSHSKISAFNYLDTTNIISSGSFVDVKLGAYEFKEIKCFENDSSDLLGIPFVWSFERVVIDFIQSKTYFIGKNDKVSNYGVHKHNYDSFWKATGIIDMKCKPEGTPFIIIEKDSTSVRYVLYGSVQFYKNNDKLDSIFCNDSLRLPNGQMKHGPFTLKSNNKL